jgi:hypothetical protein
MSGQVAAATALALTTALLYALSNVLKLLEAEQVPDEYAMKPTLIARLVRRPRWLLGLGCDGLGYITHAAALGLAALVYVEPLLATGVLMSLFIGAAFLHRPVHRDGWIAAIVLSAGLALFLYEVSPTGGHDVAARGPWLIAAGIIAVVLAAAVAAGRSLAGPPRAALFGAAAGVLFGCVALLTKAVVHYLGDGLVAWATHWEAYALVVVAAAGLVVAQSALQTGALGPAVGAIEAFTVLTGSILGITLLDEHVGAGGAVEVIAVVVAVAAVLGGIVILARVEERVLHAPAATDQVPNA